MSSGRPLARDSCTQRGDHSIACSSGALHVHAHQPSAVPRKRRSPAQMSAQGGRTGAARDGRLGQCSSPGVTFGQGPSSLTSTGGLPVAGQQVGPQFVELIAEPLPGDLGGAATSAPASARSVAAPHIVPDWSTSAPNSRDSTRPRSRAPLSTSMGGSWPWHRGTDRPPPGGGRAGTRRSERRLRRGPPFGGAGPSASRPPSPSARRSPARPGPATGRPWSGSGRTRPPS